MIIEKTIKIPKIDDIKYFIKAVMALDGEALIINKNGIISGNAKSITTMLKIDNTQEYTIQLTSDSENSLAKVYKDIEKFIVDKER